MMRDLLSLLATGNHLSADQARSVMGLIMDGKASEIETSAFLTLLTKNGENADEVAGFASTMRERCVKISPDVPGPLIDLCGTGGAPIRTFSISTIASLAVASLKDPCVYVAKHGNRAATGSIGSADLLEALGVNLSAPPDVTRRCIERHRFGFLFAPLYHPAMKSVAPVRKELPFRTVFNILGPLTNPAGVKRQLIGVFSEKAVELVSGALVRLGTERAVVVHGEGGLDEVSTTGSTMLAVAENGGAAHYRITPEEAGLRRVAPEELRPLPLPEAAAEAAAILRGGGPPAKRDAVALNGAAALYAAGCVGSIAEGMPFVMAGLASGKGADLLAAVVRETGGNSGRPGQAM